MSSSSDGPSLVCLKLREKTEKAECHEKEQTGRVRDQRGGRVEPAQDGFIAHGKSAGFYSE